MGRNWIIYLSVLWAALGSAYADEQVKVGHLLVQVTGLESNVGQVKCSLFDSPRGWPKSRTAPVGVVFAPITKKSARCVFHQLPPGRYAVTMVHDTNMSGDMELTFMGFPTEGFGFSNKAKSNAFGAPSFEQAAVMVGAKEQRRTIEVEYL